MIVAKKEIAKVFGVTEPTITTWQKNGMPIEVDGARGTSNQYDTRKCIDWFVHREVTKAFGEGPNSDGEYLDSDQELARLRHHQANKVAIEEQLLSGKVLDAEEVQLRMGKLDAEVRSALLGLPSRIAPTLVKLRTVHDIRMALHADVQSALVVLSGGDDCDDSGPP